MRDWLRINVANHPYGKSRLRALLQAMLDDGLLNLDYDLNRSQIAQQTFTARSGNCLSFSILFVAFARELDLDAQFQIVDIPPSFSAQDALVLLNNHINVRVKGIRRDVRHVQDHVVDFNSVEYNGNYLTREVNDAYAVSLYHSNVAVELIGQERMREAFQHLKRGLVASPDIAGLWVNLGVLYARAGLFKAAETAYKVALEAQPNNKSALVNMVKATRALGKNQESLQYAKRVRRYVEANPYYYSQSAREALDRGNVTEALDMLETAIALKDDEHQFYHLQGIALYRQGFVEAAHASLQEALKVAHRADLQTIYERKLDALGSDTI